MEKDPYYKFLLANERINFLVHLNDGNTLLLGKGSMTILLQSILSLGSELSDLQAICIRKYGEYDRIFREISTEISIILWEMER